ncbi:MAG TPA: hypothetical protein GXX72_02240 [Clostridiaceae bacterium]|nr:hypothetical protein [Clostridiaceae bacterium]
MNPIVLDCLVLHLTLQSGSNKFRLQADTEKPEKSRCFKTCLIMKKLEMCQMETINGGLKITTLAGLMCGAALVLAFSGVLAPLAAAPAIGCATAYAATAYWNSQGIAVE